MKWGLLTGWGLLSKFGFPTWGLISSWQRQRVPTPAVPRRASPWARLANFVKKPSLIFNVTYLELDYFNASTLVS